MKVIVFSLLILFSITWPALAMPDYGNNNISSIEINDLLQVEDEFRAGSPQWSPDGKYFLVRCSKPISMLQAINKHYLIDVENKTFGEIDFEITEDESKYVPYDIEWSPSGGKIYFTVFRRPDLPGGGFSGNIVISNPDGTDLRAIGSPNKTTLSKVIENLGGERMYGNLKFSPDGNKITYEYEDPDNIQGSIWIENINGTQSFELYSKAGNVEWYNATTFFFSTRTGYIMVTDDKGNSIQTFISDNKNEKYGGFTLSPDKQKIIIFARSEDNESRYISNINGSNLIKSEIGSWQPNGSLMLLNQNNNLFILEGDKHSKRLLYKGNATQPQWFPDGNKILFIENETQMYSIDIDGTNLSFIADIGLTSHHVWDRFFEWQQISISPSGDMIIFTSALNPSTGELINKEPPLEKIKYNAAPLFKINSDGTNLTQLTPAVQGKHDFFGEWSPDEKMFTANYIQFSKDGNEHGDNYLFSLDGKDFRYGWNEVPVSQITSHYNPVQVNNTSRRNENPEPDETIPNETKNKQSPSFSFLQFIFSLLGVLLLQKRQRFLDEK